MYIYRLLTAASAAYLEFASGKHERRRKADE